ncbi:serine/threonine protein kinase [Pendulispora rubella]|uniref:Serine/threonine protein kinase n=1 Tax=Pendulispora rubella TaxID=2741070 RepID=A0ABZ2KZ28_9BACT
MRIGRYELVAELARGGMGIVYLARVQGPGGFSKLLIIKELKPEFVDDPAILSMFVEEARLAARLQHPNVAQTIEVAQEGNRPYIAMEYLQGQSLATIHRRAKGKLSSEALLRVIIEMLRGLHYAHTLTDYDGANLGLVHRDVSPHNVFITYAGEVKVLDFGIAKAADTQLETRTGVLKGKVAYLAPELVHGREYDARVDVFSAGAMLWEAVAGRPLWRGSKEVDVLHSLINWEVPRIRSACSDISDELANICDKATAPNPAERYESAEALHLALETYLAGQPGKVNSLREIGVTIAEAFKEERERLRRILERALQDLKNGEGDRLAVITPQQGNSQLTSSSKSISWPVTRSPAVEALAPERGGHKTGRMLAGALSVLALSGTGYFVFHSKTGAPAAPEAPVQVQSTVAPSGSSPPVAPSPTPPNTFALVVRTTPPNAKLTIDGFRAQAPYSSRCPAGQALTIGANADGFVPKLEEVVCNDDIALDIALERQPAAVVGHARPPVRARAAVNNAAASPVAPPTTPSAHTPASTDVDPAGGKRPMRPIDPNNPYGNQ